MRRQTETVILPGFRSTKKGGRESVVYKPIYNTAKCENPTILHRCRQDALVIRGLPTRAAVTRPCSMAHSTMFAQRSGFCLVL